jgi:hypothetical protein
MECHFRLMHDIDLDGLEFFLIGSEVSPFTGVFDGNDCVISNFSHASTRRDYIGLFTCLSGAKAAIRGLGLIAPHVRADMGNYAGALVGRLASGTITNCWVSDSNVVGYSYTGGLVGYNGGTTTCCCAKGGIVSGYSATGGLAGRNGPSHVDPSVYGTLRNCYSTTSVVGNYNTAGMVGDSDAGSIIGCYSTGTAVGQSRVGGLVAIGWSTDVTASFWDIETSGQATSSGGTGLTTAEMQMASTFLEAGWDFVGETANGTEDIWWILEGQDYPRLWWEAAEE